VNAVIMTDNLDQCILFQLCGGKIFFLFFGT